MDELMTRTLNAKHIDEEFKFLLGDRRGRIFLWRLLVETCHVFDSGYQHNAAAYSQLAKREIGLFLLNICRTIDLALTQQAEREYWELIERSKKEGKRDAE